MNTTDGEVLATIVVATLILLLFVIFIVGFAQLFHERQKLHRQEKAEIEARFAKEILAAQIEVQTDTLQNVGQELHDNIGQLLTVAKLNLSIFQSFSNSYTGSEFLGQAHEALSQSIIELRNLTRSLDSNSNQGFSLENSLRFELERILRTKQYEINFQMCGECYNFGYEEEIVIFRMVQEILNNIIKHANASQITILLDYSIQRFLLEFTDNGKGFVLPDVHINTSGRGLQNLRRRAESIGALLELTTTIGIGTVVRIIIERSQ